MQAWHFLFILVFLVYILSDFFSQVVLQSPVNLDDPIYRRKDNFMSAADFADLSRYAIEHPFVGNWTGGQQRAGEVAMMHSWAHCNNNGFYRVCASSDIRFLCEPFLKRVREAGANAFVLKLFAGYASDYANAPSYFSSSLPLQGEAGPKIEDRYNRWVPKTVSILDLQVPAGLQGGQLQVFENTNDQERHSYYANDAGPARVEPPSPNTLHTLRGDTYYTFTDHSVDGLVPDAWTEMPSEFRRLSLVFEQYVIGNSSYHGTSEYKVWQYTVEPEKPIYTFGIVLWTIMGGFISFTANAKAIETGNVVRLAVSILVGAAFGGAFGAASSFLSIHGVKTGVRGLWDVIDVIYDGHYVYSPEATIWFLFSSVASVIATGLLWLFRDTIFGAHEGLQKSGVAEKMGSLAFGEGIVGGLHVGNEADAGRSTGRESSSTDQR